MFKNSKHLTFARATVQVVSKLTIVTRYIKKRRTAHCGSSDHTIAIAFLTAFNFDLGLYLVRMYFEK